MSQLSVSESQGTRSLILQSALSLFALYGYDGVSIRQIAEKSNCNMGSISYHFGGKKGLYRECLFSFDMNEGFLFMDVLSIGMVVDVVAGDLTRKQQMFNGYIKSINPEFKSNGDVSLKVVANSNEGGVLGVQIKDLMYPSKNHPKAWATKELMYSDIITNLAKDNGVRVDAKNIKVIKDIKAGFGKGATRQHNTTDWTFMQFLAQKIRCTLWTVEKDGNSYLHLVDNNSLVSKVSEYTFFFLSRIQRSEFIDYTLWFD